MCFLLQEKQDEDCYDETSLSLKINKETVQRRAPAGTPP
jgi:hypothetical protein